MWDVHAYNTQKMALNLCLKISSDEEKWQVLKRVGMVKYFLLPGNTSTVTGEYAVEERLNIFQSNTTGCLAVNNYIWPGIVHWVLPHW